MKYVYIFVLAFTAESASACDLGKRSSAAYVSSLQLGRPIEVKSLGGTCFYLGTLKDHLLYLKCSSGEGCGDWTCEGRAPEGLREAALAASALYQRAAVFCGRVIFPKPPNSVNEGDWVRLGELYSRLHTQVEKIHELAKDIQDY